MSLTTVSFKDAKNIMWGPTLKLNLLRAVAGGFSMILLMSLIILFDPQQAKGFGGGAEWFKLLTLPIGAPLTYLFFVPLVLLVAWLGKMFPAAWWLGFFNLIPFLLVVIGDPLLFIAAKFKPALMPMGNFRPFNFATIIFILKEESMPAA